MTLRERIARTLYENNLNRPSKPWSEVSEGDREEWLLDAEAVIEGLGLEPNDHQDGKSNTMRRWITGWFPKEDT